MERLKSRTSIAMAVYNGERFIREQLDSYLTQTRLPDELIVSDNASTDSTVEIVREFATYAPFLVRILINERNLGVTKNFERAISECTGDIIFLSDCDDVWYPEKLSLMEHALAESPCAGLAVCDADIVDEGLRPLDRRLWNALGFTWRAREQAKLRNGGTFDRRVPTTGCCMAFRARLSQFVLPLPEGYLHDIFIAFTILCSGLGGVALVPLPLVAYRQHPKQTTRTMRGAKDGEADPSVFAQRLAGRGERPTRALRPLIDRLETACRWEHSNKKLLSAVLRHWRSRSDMPTSRLARLPVVAREIVTLRYWRFSAGLLTALKDLISVH